MLKPGAAATAEILRDFAREAVAERPAAPAEVVIHDAIPVTAVGKIFKPALRRDAAERALAAAVAELGVHVAVTLDEKRGMLARVRCPPGTGAAAKHALARFALAVELVETA